MTMDEAGKFSAEQVIAQIKGQIRELTLAIEVLEKLINGEGNVKQEEQK
jgi:hypothetical protein